MAKIQITPIDPRVKQPISFILDSDTKREFIVGRDIGNSESHNLDIIVSDRTVSKYHAVINFENQHDREQWFIKDISRNGTQLNGVRLDYGNQHRLTTFGDEVLCGLNDCGFVVDSAITESGLQREFDEDDEPTINQTKPSMQSHGRTWADVAILLLNGPPEAPSWAVWVLWGLLAAGGIHLAAVWIRNQ